MKKILVSTAFLAAMVTTSIAADLPRRQSAPALPAVPVFTWTGFYVGAQAGYAWGQDETKLFLDGAPVDVGVSTEYDVDGFVGGVHAGFNYQIGSFVLGVEADAELAGVDGSLTMTNPTLPGLSAGVTTELNWQGSLRARLGAAFDRALVYVTGGLALADVENVYNVTVAPGNIFGLPPSVVSEKFDDTLLGGTIGAGVEYAFASNLTARVEYRYTQFEDVRNNSAFLAPGGSAKQEPEFHTVRAGVSYKF